MPKYSLFCLVVDSHLCNLSPIRLPRARGLYDNAHDAYALTEARMERTALILTTAQQPRPSMLALHISRVGQPDGAK